MTVLFDIQIKDEMMGKKHNEKSIRIEETSVELQTKQTDQFRPWHKGITPDSILELKLNNPNLTVRQAAKILGCQHSNIIEHLQRVGTSWCSIIDDVKNFRKNKAEILNYKQMQCLDNLTKEKAEKASMRDLAVCFGILYEKTRLEEGESTKNVSVLSARLDAAKRRLAKLDESVRNEGEE